MQGLRLRDVPVGRRQERHEIRRFVVGLAGAKEPQVDAPSLSGKAHADAAQESIRRPRLLRERDEAVDLCDDRDDAACAVARAGTSEEDRRGTDERYVAAEAEAQPALLRLGAKGRHGSRPPEEAAELFETDDPRSRPD